MFLCKYVLSHRSCKHKQKACIQIVHCILCIREWQSFSFWSVMAGFVAICRVECVRNQAKEACRDACCDRVDILHIWMRATERYMWSTQITPKLHTNWSQECWQRNAKSNRLPTNQTLQICLVQLFSRRLSLTHAHTLSFIHFHSWFLSFINFFTLFSVALTSISEP